MLLLITYVLIALIFSFLCSIAEAVLLSINSSYVVLLEKAGRKSEVARQAMNADLATELHQAVAAAQPRALAV